MPFIKEELLDKLITIRQTRLIWLSVAFSIICAEMIVMPMSMIYHGRIAPDLVIISLVCASLVSLIVSYLLVHLINQVRDKSDELERYRIHLQELVDTRTIELRQQKAILNSIPNMAWLKDDQNRYIAVNEAFEEFTGLKSNNVIGRTDLDIWPKDFAERYLSDDKEVIKTGLTIQVEEQCIDRYTGNVWLEIIKTPIHIDDGKVIGTTGIARDISERKRADDALIESEAMHRNLCQELTAFLDAATDILILLSPDLKILWTNKAAAAFYNAAGDELIGRACFTIRCGRSDPCEECNPMICFDTGEVKNYHINTNDGKIMEMMAFPVKNEKKAVTKVLLAGRDVTEKVKMQAERARTSQLASLGVLSASVAHEINNPINGIINYAQLLINTSLADSRDHDIYLRILKEGNRIAGIVNNLLFLARDKKEVKCAVAVHKILADALDLTSIKIRRDGIQLYMEIAEELPDIYAHPSQIQQVFLNIIHNAQYALEQKYSAQDRHRQLLVAADTIIKEGGRHVRIAFHDNGIGIPASVKEMVVNPFFTTKPAGKGTGLGLSICNDIIREHGGSLTIDSKEGEYTRVIVDLPAGEKS